MSAHLLAKHWVCPNCEAQARTHGSTTAWHHCKGLRGLYVALVPAGLKAKVEVVEREDYVGREMVQTDSTGRPVMAIVTTRDDGQDCTVLAPAARVDKRE